jgi:general nucleoside transport system permease protein
MSSFTIALHGAGPMLRRPVVVSIAAVLAALLAGLLLIALAGANLSDAVDAFIDGSFGSGYVIAASVNRAVAYALVGLGFIYANRANLTNVGGEGQIAVGGIVATATALFGHVDHLPLGLAFIVPMLLGTVAGALWGLLAGLLRVKTGTNEVISTLLLSFIGYWLVYWSVQSVHLLRRPMTDAATLPESLEIPQSTKLPLLLGDAGVPLNLGLPMTLLLAFAVAVVLSKTIWGWRLAAMGLNPTAAQRAGISQLTTVAGALAIAGAFGGLAGAVMLQGDQTVLKSGFSSGYGFDGLVVGLLARGSSLGVIAGSLLFGFLRSGGINMEMVAQVPSAVVQVIQGLIVVSLAGAAFWVERSARP